MYRNWGDTNFFEYGILVDTDHSDTVFSMLRCIRYYDEENLFQFAHLEVDIEDSWIDRNAVMDFIGMTEYDFEPVLFAIGCTDYYSWDNFGALDYGVYYDWRFMDRESILKELNNYLISYNNLELKL